MSDVENARRRYLMAAWCSDIYRRLPSDMTDWDKGHRLQLLTDAASISLDHAAATAAARKSVAW